MHLLCSLVRPTPQPSPTLTHVICVAADQGQSDNRDDPAAQRLGPAGLPRQLRGHRSRGGALRLRLAGRTQAGQPTGGDLQGGGGVAFSRADDRSPQDVCHCQGGYNTPARGLHPAEVKADLKW